MSCRECLARSVCVGIIACTTSLMVRAHSASDAYLTLTAEKPGPQSPASSTIVRGEWDIALRDLDFVLGLDENGDGRIAWGELRRHQNAIANYAYGYIHATAGGKACTIEPTRQLVDYHADGAYAALFYNIVCPGAPKHLALDYRLFFEVDPSHRGILVMHSANNVATAVLSPEHAVIDLEL